MKNNRFISTVIPTFNRELYLKKAIQSSLDQTINHEIIVCNHGGIDGTDEMIKQFNGQIKYIKKKTDRGLVYCILDGVMEAKGELINLLFDDDWIEPTYIEECIKYFENPKVGFVFTPAKLYDDDDQKVEFIDNDDFLLKDGIYKVSKYESNFLRGFMSPTAFIIRKKDMIDSLYNGKLPLEKYSYRGVGYDRLMLLLCMLRYSSFGFVKKPLVYYRKHKGSITVDGQLEKSKSLLIKKAYEEVDKYYYTIKYGKIFSFLINNYIKNIRFILNNPILSLKKLIKKINKKINKKN